MPRYTDHRLGYKKAPHLDGEMRGFFIGVCLSGCPALFLLERFVDGYEYQQTRQDEHQDGGTIQTRGLDHYDVAQSYPKQRQADELGSGQRFSHDNLHFCSSTIASITATTVIFMISRTELSKSTKWIGLFNPIWIGPISSVSGDMARNSL